MTAYTDNWNERICPICGRHFYPPTDEWVYRRGSFFCVRGAVCARSIGFPARKMFRDITAGYAVRIDPPEFRGKAGAQ